MVLRYFYSVGVGMTVRRRRRAQRGVYVTDYTVNGRVTVYSVKSDGERHHLRVVLPDQTEIDAASVELWVDLNRDDALSDPQRPADASPSPRVMLRLVPRSVPAAPPLPAVVDREASS